MWLDGRYQTIRDSSGNDAGPCTPHVSNACKSYRWLTAFTVTNPTTASLSVDARDYGLFPDKLLAANEFNFRFVTTDAFSVHSSNPFVSNVKMTFTHECSGGTLFNLITAPADLLYIVESDGTTAAVTRTSTVENTAQAKC